MLDMPFPYILSYYLEKTLFPLTYIKMNSKRKEYYLLLKLYS